MLWFQLTQFNYILNILCFWFIHRYGGFKINEWNTLYNFQILLATQFFTPYVFVMKSSSHIKEKKKEKKGGVVWFDLHTQYRCLWIKELLDVNRDKDATFLWSSVLFSLVFVKDLSHSSAVFLLVLIIPWSGCGLKQCSSNQFTCIHSSVLLGKWVHGRDSSFHLLQLSLSFFKQMDYFPLTLSHSINAAVRVWIPFRTW